MKTKKEFELMKGHMSIMEFNNLRVNGSSAFSWSFDFCEIFGIPGKCLFMN